ncbi:MAG: PaaI family thioesterase [Gemmatimonadota bacterium]
MLDAHHRALERMYHGSAINVFYEPTLRVDHESAEIEMAVDPKYFHPAGAIHGSVTWKMLDDAAFFAAASIEDEVFVLTTSFTSYLTRPVSEGILRSVGRISHRNRTQILAESIAYDGEGREVARGNGLFVRSTVRLADIPEYELQGE